MAQPDPFQHYLNLRTRLNQGDYENRITQIRKQAQQAFQRFNPAVTPAGQLNTATFNYIGRFVQLDQEVNAIRADINQLPTNFVPANQLPTANQQAEARRIFERVGRVEALRNILREYLLDGGFADDQQLRGAQPGYNNRVPRRFRYAEPSGNYQIATEMVTEYLNQVRQLLQQCPTAYQFEFIRTMAKKALTLFERNPTQQPAFNYINFFQARNERFEQLEFRIEAGLELLERIEKKLSNLMSQEQKDQVREFWRSFIKIRTERGMTRTDLVQRNFATDDQLTFGYKGETPPAFQVQPQGGGQGQVQPAQGVGQGQGQVQPTQGRGRKRKR